MGLLALVSGFEDRGHWLVDGMDGDRFRICLQTMHGLAGVYVCVCVCVCVLSLIHI